MSSNAEMCDDMEKTLHLAGHGKMRGARTVALSTAIGAGTCRNRYALAKPWSISVSA